MKQYIKYLLFIFEIIGIVSQSYAQTDSPDITPSNIAAALEGEIHISISKVYPGNLVLSAMTGNYGTPTQVSRFISKDYGQTWTGTEYSNTATNYADPTSAFDASGNAYLIQMVGNVAGTGTGGMSLQKCTNPMTASPTWGAETQVYLNGGVGGNCDKEMIIIDNLPSSPFVNNIYNAWAGSGLRFQRSTDGGATFSSPALIGSGRGPHLQTGPGGEVYALWIASESYYNDTSTIRGTSNFGFARSTDGGSTFSYTNSSAFSFKSITRMDAAYNTQSNGNIVHNFGYLAVDKSCVPTNSHRGRIYAAYPYLTGQNPTRSEIRVRFSDDQGTTWPAANERTVSVSTYPKCYYPYIVVDDATGIVLVKYSTVENTTYSNNIYVAYSTDGGNTFNNIKVNDNPFSSGPATGGHYHGLAAYAGIAYPAWSDNHTTVAKNWVSPVKFTAPTYYNSTTDLNINGPLVVSTISSSVNYSAKQSISAPAINNTMKVASGSSVYLTAEQAIYLVPGFSSDIGANLSATIGPVSSCMSTTSRIASSETTNENETSQKEILEITAFPNPVSEVISFRYELTEDANVDIRLYDETGKEVSTINNNTQTKGIHEVFGVVSNLPDGTYIYIAKLGEVLKKGRIIKQNIKTSGEEEEEEREKEFFTRRNKK